MKKYDIQILHPPKVFETGAHLKPGVVVKAVPVAAIFTAKGLPTEICRQYGYVMLLGQNLEFELRECLTTMQFSLANRGIECRFPGDPRTATFDRLIDMLAARLNTNHRGTKDFIDELHRARKLRNRLAHGFFTPTEDNYFLTPGGQQKILHHLKSAEEVFFPVIMFVGHIGCGYAADYGITADYVERRHKQLEAERRQIESDLKDIFGDEETGDGKA